MNNQTRLSKKFWYVSETFHVEQVSGFACSGEPCVYWWCPAVGVSAAIGHSLFYTRKEALRHAYAKCLKQLNILRQRTNKLKKALRVEREDSAAEEMIDRAANR